MNSQNLPRKKSQNIPRNKNILIPRYLPTEYIGEYDSEDLRTGFGILKWSNGCSLKGYFKRGRINGWGILTFSNNDIFRGEFVDNKANGYGEYVYKNGKIN